MLVSKFDPQQFFRRSDAVALLVPAAELFGFLKRALDLPLSWAALVTRATGEHVLVPAGGKVESDEAETVLFTRATPLDLVYQEEGVLTRDGFQCTAELRLRLRPILERSELLSFQRTVLGSHRAITLSSLQSYFQSHVRKALANEAQQSDAADLVGRAPDSFVSSIAQAVEPLCFSAGLVLEGPVSVRFDSPTFRQVLQAKEESVRRRYEHEAGRQVQEALEHAQNEHLDHLAALLSRLSQLAEDSPQAELPQLIRTFSERQRGELYEALFASDKPIVRTRWIVVAVGEELLFFDPRSFGSPQRRLSVSGALGPVRSVQCATDAEGRAVLWLGALTGVYRLPIERAEPDLTLTVAGSPSVRGGFNAVAASGQQVWASHSELGLYEWDLDKPAAGRSRFASMTRGAKAVRAVQLLSEDVYCAVDDRILSGGAADTEDYPKQVFTGSRATITALSSSAAGLLAGNSEGDILFWPKDKETAPRRLSAGNRRAAESVWLLDTHGVQRIVYTDTSMYVHAAVLGDSFTCRYEAGGQTLRRVDVAPDLFVATTELRDRLICWLPWQPARPVETIAVSAQCGRSVQDVCLVPDSASVAV